MPGLAGIDPPPRWTDISRLPGNALSVHKKSADSFTLCYSPVPYVTVVDSRRFGHGRAFLPGGVGQPDVNEKS